MLGKMDCAGLTDVGRVRPVNEDQYLIASLSRSMQVHSTSLDLDDQTRLFGSSQGRLLLVNPAPGTLGNLGMKWIEGPPILGLDVNLIKRIRLTETKEFEFRIDTVNVLNHANFDNPDTNINSTTFGRITGLSGNPGNRRFTLNARLNF